jgi:hypothetical protein
MSTPLRQPDDSPIKPRVPPRVEVPQARPKVISAAGREQEQSIRERKQLLFEEDEAPTRPALEPEPVKPFPEYLRTTPAAPLSGLARAILWGAGLLVVLLFVAALVKMGNRPAKPTPTRAPAASSPRAK